MTTPQAALAAELELLAPLDEVPAPDWPSIRRRASIAKRKSPFRRTLLIVAALAALVLIGVATAMVIERSGDRSGVHARVYNGPVTLNVEGAVTAVDALGHTTPIWNCPHQHGCGILNGIAWSRDGRWLAYSRPRWARRTRADGLYVVDLSSRRQWHVEPEVVGCNIAYDLQWSPDGRQIAYACPASIFVVSRVLTGRREIDTEAAGPGRRSSPTWAADGRSIAFAVRRGTVEAGRSAVYVTGVTGERLRLLATGATAPAWSPDGRRLAVRASCGGIELLTPTGRNVTPGKHRACPAMGVPGIPMWSPDGSKLVIQMRPHGGVYMIDRDGTHLSVLARRGSPADTGGGAFGGDRPAWRPTHLPPSAGKQGAQGGV